MQSSVTRFSPILALSPIIFALGGCAVSAQYTAPTASSSPMDYSVVVNRPYDETWKKLIEYTAGTFFGIDNYEKASGLMTLNFGSANPPEFITGGPWKFSNMVANFEGDYTEYLTTYANAKLDGRMNIVVAPEGPDTTKVTVNARYVFSAQMVDGPLDTWSFNSGNCGTIRVKNPALGTQPMRTICPTYKAERAVLDAIK